MAQKNIGLRIEINGFRGVVTNLEQLNTLIKESKEDLQQLEIGSDLFNELSGQIKIAETQFKKFQEAAQGQGLKTSLEGYGKLVGGITSSFAAAQAAVSLFGTESELVTEAATKAQNLLTVAIAARSIGEVKLGLSIVGTTIATKAQTLAINTTNTSLKALYSTIAANPMTALISVIGLAVTALVAFSSAADDAAESQKKFNESIKKEAGQTIGTLQTLSATIMNNKISIDQRKKAIEDLRKIAGPYYKDLTDEQILTRNLTDDVKNLTAAVIKQAEAQALRQRIQERATQILTLEDELAAAQQLVDKYKELENTTTGVIGGGSVGGFGGAETSAIVNTNKLAGAVSNLNGLQAQLSGLRNQSEKDIRRLTSAETTYTKVLGDGLKEYKDQNKELEKRITLNLKQIEIIKRRVESEKRDAESLGKEFKGTSEAIILPLLKKRIDELESEIKFLTGFLETEAIKLNKTLSNVFSGITTSLTKEEKEIVKAGDEYLKLFSELFGDINDSSKSLETFLTGKLSISVDEIQRKINKFNTSKILTDEQKIELTNYFNSILTKTTDFQNLLNNIKEQQKELPKQLKLPEIQIKDEKQTYDLLIKFAKEYEELLIENGQNVEIATKKLSESVKKQVKDLNISIDGINLSDIFGDIVTLDEKGQKVFEETKVKVEQYNKTIEDLVKSLTSGVITISEFSVSVGKTAIEIQTTTNKFKELQEQNEAFRKSVKELATSGDTEKFQQFLKTLGATEIDFLKLITSDLQKFRKEFGDAGLINIFKNVGDSIKDLDKKTREELEGWLNYLIATAQTIKTEFGDESAKAIEDAIERIRKALKKLPKEVDEDFQNLLENILTGLQIFTQSIGDIAALTRDRFSFELEKLETGYSKTLTKVVGDTKEANQKRLELEQQYQTQKAAIEKKARVRSLQFQLAQTIADTAAAVVRTIAEFGATPLGIGLSLVAGGIGAAQVGLIAEQISFAQSLRRGGNLSRMAAGGTINGPSHENGGVKFMNGGFELEGNEAVINRMSTLNYSGLLSQINESGGGRPILVSSPMDSRLIEVLAKDRQTPIRAYVVEQDITEAQQINKKLEQLASF
jgi:hypothetical protein